MSEREYPREYREGKDIKSLLDKTREAFIEAARECEVSLVREE